MLEMLFGTKLERLNRAYTKHERAYNAVVSKLKDARYHQNYDLVDRLEATAHNHASMMDYYAKVIAIEEERIAVEMSPVEVEE